LTDGFVGSGNHASFLSILVTAFALEPVEFVTFTS